MVPPPPTALCPYTTLFRSQCRGRSIKARFLKQVLAVEQQAGLDLQRQADQASIRTERVKCTREEVVQIQVRVRQTGVGYEVIDRAHPVGTTIFGANLARHEHVAIQGAGTAGDFKQSALTELVLGEYLQRHVYSGEFLELGDVRL